MAHDALQCGRDRSRVPDKLRRIFVQDGGHRLRAGVPIERTLPLEHFVENAADTENIRAMLGGLALHPLRRHVSHRTQYLADIGLRYSRGFHGCVERSLPMMLC